MKWPARISLTDNQTDGHMEMKCEMACRASIYSVLVSFTMNYMNCIWTILEFGQTQFNLMLVAFYKSYIY